MVHIHVNMRLLLLRDCRGLSSDMASNELVNPCNVFDHLHASAESAEREPSLNSTVH